MSFIIKSEMTGKELAFINAELETVLEWLNGSCEELVEKCENAGCTIIDMEYSEIPANVEISATYKWRF